MTDRNMEINNELLEKVLEQLEHIAQQQLIIINELTKEPDESQQLAEILGEVLRTVRQLAVGQSTILKHITRT